MSFFRAHLLVFLFSSISFYGYAQHKLRIEVGLEAPKGQVHITVYNSEECFLEKGGAFLNAWIIADSTCVEHTFYNLPTAYYAIVVLMDRNENRKVDQNFLGIPNEPYGFSKNFKPILRAPKFHDVAIYLDKNRTLDILMLNN